MQTFRFTTLPHTPGFITCRVVRLSRSLSHVLALSRSLPHSLPHVGRALPSARAGGRGRELRTHRFDVVGLQEMWTRQTQTIFREAGYRYAAPYGNGNWRPRLRFLKKSGLVTLSRHPIVESEMLPFSRTCGLERFVRKSALFTRIRCSSNRYVDVYNLHMMSLPEGAHRYFTRDETTFPVRAHQIEELHDESNLDTGEMPSGKTSKADFEDDHEKFKGTYVQA